MRQALGAFSGHVSKVDVSRGATKGGSPSNHSITPGSAKPPPGSAACHWTGPVTGRKTKRPLVVATNTPALRAHPHCVSDEGLRPRHKVAPNFPFGSCEVAVSASLPWASPIPNCPRDACKLHNYKNLVYTLLNVNYSITLTHVNTQRGTLP